MLPTEIAPPEMEPAMEAPPELAPPPEVPARNWALAGEALAAVTGIFPEGEITPEQGEEAQDIARRLQAGLAKFCRFGPFAKFEMQPQRDFEEVFALLAPLTDDEIRTATADISEPELVEAWTDTVNRARSYLKMRWPVYVRQTPTGPDWVTPSKTAGGEALALLHVLEKPERLVDEMNRGAMTPSMVAAVEAVFPQLFQATKAILTLELKQLEAKKTRCPWRHELLIRMLFGLAPVGLVTFPADTKQAADLGSVDIAFGGDDLKTKNQGLK